MPDLSRIEQDADAARRAVESTSEGFVLPAHQSYLNKAFARPVRALWYAEFALAAAEALEIAKDFEYVYFPDVDRSECPECHYKQGDGHYQDCRWGSVLAAVLRRLRGGGGDG